MPAASGDAVGRAAGARIGVVKEPQRQIAARRVDLHPKSGAGPERVGYVKDGHMHESELVGQRFVVVFAKKESGEEPT